MGRVGCEAVPVDDGTESMVVEVVVVAGVTAAFIVEASMLFCLKRWEEYGWMDGCWSCRISGLLYGYELQHGLVLQHVQLLIKTEQEKKSKKLDKGR